MMIKIIYGNSNFNDLLQESYLAGTSILSGIEYLKKAELFSNHDGMFYSAFFSLSIGIERFLKIALVSEYMYQNNYQKPSDKFLKEPGHNLLKLLKANLLLTSKYDINSGSFSEEILEYDLISFLSTYATTNRYLNLNNLTNANYNNHKHPIHEWVLLSERFLRESVKYEKIEKELIKIYSKNEKYGVGYTNLLDFNGHPLLTADIWQFQYIVNKSKPYILYRLIQTLKPIYRMLDKISFESNNGPNADLGGLMNLPYYGELFPFFYADLDTLKKVKKWVGRYN
ncbi:hypothetical protein LV34_00957 [Acinetobacter baumannii]|nr:hypothetical protein LV34_00957 [Acinetobacter baumannii]